MDTISGSNYFVFDFDIANVRFDENIPYANIGYRSNSNNYQKPFYIVSNANRDAFYVSMDTTLDASDIKISSTANVWNHITFVIDTSKNAYVFVDGEYLGKLNPLASGSTRFLQFVITVGGVDESNYDVEFNIDIDNIVIGKPRA